MSNSSWKEKLAQVLPPPATSNPRLALVGIGSELKGDDAAGVAAAKLLRPLFASREDVLVLEAGPVPESFTGPLRRFAPAFILLIDAGDFGGLPGEVRLIDWRSAEGFSASTHTLPLSVFATYLEQELGAVVALLAVQPLALEFGQDLSPQVEASIQEIVTDLVDLLKPAAGAAAQP